MAERIITVLTSERVPDLLANLDDAAVKSRWENRTENDRYETNVLVDVGDSEAVMDALHARFEKEDDYRLILVAVEATLPLPEPDEEDEASDEASGEQPQATTTEEEEEQGKERPKSQRISRDELYSDVNESATLTWRYLVMVALATVVAAGGMMRDSVAVIIGAMVIAPLLGPNIALSLATTLADPKLARRALTTGIAGLGLGLGLSLLLGALLPVTLENAEIASRAQVNFADVALALAAGAAGALSFTGGAPTGVIGVMVAVALLPPLVAAGLLYASGLLAAGFSALLLVAVNLICINLSGVLTFLLQGISPRDRREEKAAWRATVIAIAIWAVLLLALGALIVLRGPIEVQPEPGPRAQIRPRAIRTASRFHAPLRPYPDRKGGTTMSISDSDHVAEQATGLLHHDTQEFPFGLDLTVAEVNQLTGPGSLDFGGSEFEAAPTEVLEPAKRDHGDDYGWWPLGPGTYLIRYNEGLELDEAELGLVHPHPRLMRAGAHHPSFTVFGQQDDLFTLLSVGAGGCDIKENSRVSRLLILGS